MAIELREFDFGFRKMCSTFGVQYSAERMKTYYEVLGSRIKSGEDWRQIVLDCTTKMDMFPRLSVILKHDLFRKDLETSAKGVFDPARWIAEDCRVKQCDNGMIYAEVGKGSVMYACPRCQRGTKEVSGIMLYKGKVDLYTDAEMESRRKERLDIANDSEYRWRRAKDVVRFLQTYGEEEKPK